MKRGNSFVICGLSFIMLFLSGCFDNNNDNLLFYEKLKNNDFSKGENKKYKLSNLQFYDWTYPKLEDVMSIPKDNPELYQYSFKSDLFHGLIFTINDTSSDNNKIQFICFLPRSNQVVVDKIKRTCLNKLYCTIECTYIDQIPIRLWINGEEKIFIRQSFTLNSFRND
ncbi:MAG: hypothetical protein A2086_14490 [Spirochaetes bacterium GWD1_27_9]|nr:MAG: hypothetical protein A2Z98_16325 [Spirochaetes bacterium GWB1_27_13]OHD23562.1 MAG: hypothetical protein A2Y34_02155 [Spirochaetes bacterium GWC1_27_15]OHD33764.1 MAG: hypothetical protein A2086_14490 [Spirochaetes bacterium GWD1_27_9]